MSGVGANPRQEPGVSLATESVRQPTGITNVYLRRDKCEKPGRLSSLPARAELGYLEIHQRQRRGGGRFYVCLLDYRGRNASWTIERWVFYF